MHPPVLLVDGEALADASVSSNPLECELDFEWLTLSPLAGE